MKYDKVFLTINNYKEKQYLMKNKILIKCSNCGRNEFKPTTIGFICATEGEFHVNAYACQSCGHIELFAPELDLYAKQLKEEKEEKRKQEELQLKQEEDKRQQRIRELTEIINNENSTIRQVNEAKKRIRSFA